MLVELGEKRVALLERLNTLLTHRVRAKALQGEEGAEFGWGKAEAGGCWWAWAWVCAGRLVGSFT